jgi:acyl-CoA thioesterase-1
MSNDATPRCVLFLGDSLVAGIGDPAGGGWVARVVGACFDRGRPITAYNLGIRRETSTQIAARWHAEATPRMLLEDGAIRVSPQRSRRALAAVLEQASASGFAPFVIGPAPVDDAEQKRRIGDLTEAFAEVCAERAGVAVESCLLSALHRATS